MRPGSLLAEEPFNIEKLREHYTVSLDPGNMPLTQELHEDSERQCSLSAAGSNDAN